jgi:hypothetical protein
MYDKEKLTMPAQDKDFMMFDTTGTAFLSFLHSPIL